MRNPLLLAAALAPLIAGCGQKAPFSAREREIITRSDSVMYVTVVSDPADSLLLRTPCAPLTGEELASELFAELSAKLLATVQAPEQGGVGIAAPQVGILRRVAAIQRLDLEGEPFVIYPNIRVVRHLGDTVRSPEGCLSIPGLRGIVPRSEGVVISWTDPQTLQERSEEIHGYTAIIFQHETDHLDGILYTDRADSLLRNPAWEAERAPFAAQGAYDKPAWWPDPAESDSPFVSRFPLLFSRFYDSKVRPERSDAGVSEGERPLSH